MFLVGVVNVLTTIKIDFLKSIGSDKVKHSGRTLLEHLIGTSEILKKLGTPEYLQDAGLFHSVYGTAYFMPEGGLVNDRQTVKDLIGEEAEEIAYYFCMLDHPRIQNIFKIEPLQLRNDLVLLNSANIEDQTTDIMMTWEEAYDL